MSASLRLISPKSAIGWPNCRRSVAYCVVVARIFFEVPAQLADIFMRPRLSVHMATLWPLPTSPSRLPTGIATSSSCRAHTEEPCRPRSFSCPPTESPGLSRSRRKAEKAVPSTLAKRMNRSAQPALVIHCLDPLTM